MKKVFLKIGLLLSITVSAQKTTVVDSIGIYNKKGDFFKAIILANKKAKSYLDQKKYPDYCATNIQRSSLYIKLNDKKKAFQILFTTLRNIENTNLSLQKAQLFKELANNYVDAYDIRKGTHYYYKALSIVENTKYDTLSGRIYQGLFKLHFERKELDSVKFYIEKVKKAFLIEGSYIHKAELYNDYFGYYSILKQPLIAKKYLDTCNYYSQLSKNPNQISSVINNLAYHYILVEKDNKKAEKEYLKIVKLYEKDSLNNNVVDAYLNLSYVYEQMKDFKLANAYLNKYIVAKANIFDTNLNQQIQDVETRYKVKEKENAFNAKETQIKKAQRKRQLFFLIVIVVLILLLILIAIFYQFNKLKQKNKLNELESNLKENLINATIDGQEAERKNVAAVLHDNVSALLSSAGLQLMAFSAKETNKSDEIVKAKAIIKEAHDKVRDLSHQLVPTLLSKFGLIYGVQDLCEKNSNSTITFDFQSNVSSKTRYDEDFEMKLYFIVSEMINNVLKHSKASQAKVSINKENNDLLLQVKDNGQGFENSRNKSNEGFGITQIRARINNLNGKLFITSQINEGTTVTIQVPLVEKA